MPGEMGQKCRNFAARRRAGAGAPTSRPERDLRECDMLTPMKRAAAAFALATLLTVVGARGQEAKAPERSAEHAFLVELSTGFVPVANDVPMMLSAGLRLAGAHEVWVRGGYMPTGDDAGLGFFALGYRVVLRRDRWLRPILGGLGAVLPEQCTHDAERRPTCDRIPLFVVAATAGLRIEPVRTLGFYAQVALGMDSYPNPFGMAEAGMTVVLPFAPRAAVSIGESR